MARLYLQCFLDEHGDTADESAIVPRIAMCRPLRDCAVALLWAAVLSPACGSSPGPPRELVTVARPIGSWQGKGSKTIESFMSDSGRLRIKWAARGEDPPRSGTFRLIVRSAVSGRPLQVVVDHRGEGSGTTQFEDDPRLYDLQVESTNIEWSFTVEEVYKAYADEASPSSPRKP